MKTIFVKALSVTTLSILMMATLMQTTAFGQETTLEEKGNELTQENAQEKSRNARRLEGAWDLTVTARNCQTGAAIRTFPSMHTYMRGGTMQDFGTGGAPLPRSSGQGIWSYLSNGHYSAAFQFFRFNADGTNAGRQINRVQIELSPDGSSYASSSTAQTFDVNGNLIATNCFTALAERFE
jgi:hypothetical protein